MTDQPLPEPDAQEPEQPEIEPLPEPDAIEPEVQSEPSTESLGEHFEATDAEDVQAPASPSPNVDAGSPLPEPKSTSADLGEPDAVSAPTPQPQDLGMPDKVETEVSQPESGTPEQGRLNLDDAEPMDIPGLDQSPGGDIGRAGADLGGSIAQYHKELVEVLRLMRSEIDILRREIEELSGWHARSL